MKKGKKLKKVRKDNGLTYAEWNAFEKLKEDNPIVKRYTKLIDICSLEDKEWYYQRMIMELAVLIELMYENLVNVHDEAEAGLEDYFDIMGDPK